MVISKRPCTIQLYSYAIVLVELSANRYVQSVLDNQRHGEEALINYVKGSDLGAI